MSNSKVQPEYTVMSRRERAVCGTLCICLGLMVMSAVAMVYMTVIIYIPAKRELSSGFGDTSVMCTTREKRRIKGDIAACRWNSCSEWCLSRGGGDCTHLYVSVRSNGTNIKLEGCSNTLVKACPTLDVSTVKKVSCKEDHQCTQLDKMFRCKNGICWNVTDVYTCRYDDADADNFVSCQKKRNCVELQGMYDCVSGRCRRINNWSCERRCVDIDTRGRNVILQQGDNIILSNCPWATEIETGESVWKASHHPDKILITSCTNLLTEEHQISGFDCINGTLLPQEALGTMTNYTVLNAVVDKFGYDNRMDRTATFVPFERDIMIFNSSKLMINHEGCVNTLQDECKTFYKLYGRDGRNQTSPARFPCYYAPHNPEFVLKRFDASKTKKMFLLFFVVPAALLIFSCGILFTCSRILNIDNYGHMVIKCCDKDDFDSL